MREGTPCLGTGGRGYGGDAGGCGLGGRSPWTIAVSPLEVFAHRIECVLVWRTSISRIGIVEIEEVNEICAYGSIISLNAGSQYLVAASTQCIDSAPSQTEVGALACKCLDDRASRHCTANSVPSAPIFEILQFFRSVALVSNRYAIRSGGVFWVVGACFDGRGRITRQAIQLMGSIPVRWAGT